MNERDWWRRGIFWVISCTCWGLRKKSECVKGLITEIVPIKEDGIMEVVSEVRCIFLFIYFGFWFFWPALICFKMSSVSWPLLVIIMTILFFFWTLCSFYLEWLCFCFCATSTSSFPSSILLGGVKGMFVCVKVQTNILELCMKVHFHIFN